MTRDDYDHSSSFTQLTCVHITSQVINRALNGAKYYRNSSNSISVLNKFYLLFVCYKLIYFDYCCSNMSSL